MHFWNLKIWDHWKENGNLLMNLALWNKIWLYETKTGSICGRYFTGVKSSKQSVSVCSLRNNPKGHDIWKSSFVARGIIQPTKILVRWFPYLWNHPNILRNLVCWLWSHSNQKRVDFGNLGLLSVKVSQEKLVLEADISNGN